MFYSGLVSISFRDHSAETISISASQLGLKNIEWGSDLHAPCNDIEELEKVSALQTQYGLNCCSYGTYFRLGYTPMQELPQYIHAAKSGYFG